MKSEKKETTATFRTSEQLKQKLSALADRVKNNRWKFKWNTPERNCFSLSGLIHEVLSGNVNVDELETKLEKIEEDNS